MSVVRSLTDRVTNFVGDLTGANQVADAQRDGARIQAQAGQNAIDRIDASQALFREDLTPFREELGYNLLPQVAQLYGPDAGTAMLNNPIFQALADDATRRTLAAQASVGRAGAGETGPLLQDQLLRTGYDLLSRERGDLLNAIGYGQNAATQVGVTGNQNAVRIGDLLTQIGNVNAAGGMAGANARRQSFQDLLQIGGATANAFGFPV